MLYTLPNSSFIQNPAGDSVVTVQDSSGSIATLQTAIDNTRTTNPNSIIVVRLLSGATYWVTNAGIVLGSTECLLATGATIKAANASVSVPLIQITAGSTNASVSGGTLDGNGASINGIVGSTVSRVNVDNVTVQNCGLDCILLTGKGNSTYDNELSVTRCDASGSPAHAGISIQSATQAACVDNNCHHNSSGIYIACAYGTFANNTCETNTVGIEFHSGNDNVIANNTCNYNGTGILLDGSSSMIVSDSMGGNGVAGVNSSGSGNILIDNVFTAGNAANFINSGSGDKIVAYKGPLSAPGQDYFYPPLVNDQHTNTIVNGMGRTDLTIGSTTVDSVQTQYNSARSANPTNAIVLHLNGTFTVGATPLLLSSNTCVLLNGMIQINSSTAASSAISDGTTPSHVCISGGIIDGGNLTGNNGIQFSSSSMLQVDGMTLRNFGPSNPRVGGSDVIHFDHGFAPYIVTRCTINGGSARGIWLQLSGVKSLMSDNEVSNVNQDGVDCDSSTSGCVAKFNYCHDLVRYGVFIEQSASHNLALGNICNNDGRDINLYNNSATPRGDTAYNSVVCNWCMGNNGLRNGSTSTNVVQTSHNFIFDNVVINASISSELYGTQNYYSQNYQSGGSLSTAGTESFFNSSDTTNSFMQDVNSGLAILVQNAATNTGAAIVTGMTTGLGNDHWQLIPTDSGFYKIINRNSGLVLAVQSAATNAGAKIIQWTFGSAKNDQWMPVSAGNGAWNLVNRLSGLYLDVTGASLSPGTQLDQQPPNSLANQQFRLPTSLVIGTFSLAANPASQAILPGSNTLFTVIVTTNGGFSGTVNLGVSGLPVGATGGLNPSVLNGSGSSSLSITTAPGVLPGNYTLTIRGTNGTTVASTAVTLKIASPSGAPGTLLWTGAGTSLDWSDAPNWTNVTSGGFGPPGISNDVVFTNFAVVASSNTVNNILNSDTSVSSITFNTTNGFHATQISPGSTLTASGAKGLFVGTETDLGANATVYGSILGTGGTLLFSNVNANFTIRQGTSASGGTQRGTLDLSGLDTFNANLNQISVGVAGSVVRATGTLELAKVNSITAAASPGILVGDNGSNAGGQSRLYLGQDSSIFADSITIARQKANGLMAFNPAFASPSALFRGANGAGRVAAWNIGDNSAQSTSSSSSRGTNDFTGGSVDAMVDTLVVGKSQKTTGADSFGTLTFESGTFDVNTLEIGYQAQSGATSAGIGTVNVNGLNAVLTVNTLLELGHSSGTGATNTLGALNINGGTVQTPNLVAGTGLSTVNLTAGTLDLQRGQISNIFALNVGAAAATGAALLQSAASISSPNPITVAPNGTIAGNPAITAPALLLSGMLSPGSNGGVGATTNSGDLVLYGGGSLVLAIQNATGGPAIGWSFVQTGGRLDVESAPTNRFVIQLESLGATGLGDVTNFDAGTNYDWFIATASGGITNFNNTSFALNTDDFLNDLSGGYFFIRTNGNALILSFSPPPLIQNVSLSGGMLIFSGKGGIPSAPFSLLSSTNLLLPLSAWTTFATNTFASDGTFAVSVSVNPLVPQTYYRLRLP
jgi:parallel beta-helix repeat protein